VVAALAAAAAEGDRSENAEYSYRKKQLGEIDRRIRYLSKRLDVIKVVDEAPADQSKVRFGAAVTLQAGQAAPRQYRIVGVDETRTGKGWISVDSPLARALLGKSAGDIVKVDLPAGRERYEILEVAYPDLGDTA
jgi:transcription elongation factor GreB